MRNQATTIGGRVIRGVLTWIAWLGSAAVLSAATWTGGTATWADDDNGPWATTAPVAAEAVSLTQATASDITITYAGNQVLGLTGTETFQGTRFGNLSLNNSGGGTTTLAVGAGDMLPIGSSATIGVGGKLDVSGGTFTPEGSLNLQPGGAIAQSGGLIQPRLYDLNMSGGTYAISDGTSSFRQVVINPSAGTATINLTGGTLETRQTSGIRNSLTPSGTGQVEFNNSGGTHAAPATMLIGVNATYHLSGTGILNSGHISLTGGHFKQTGGTLSLSFDITATSGQVTFDGAATTGLRTLYVGTGAGSVAATIENGAEVSLSGNTALSVGGSTGSGALTLDNATARGPATGRHVTIDAGGEILLQNTGLLGTGTIRFGNLTVNGNGSLTVNSGSEAHFVYDSAINDGAVTLNDGVYTTRKLSIGTAGGSGVVTLNGGSATYAFGTGDHPLTVGGATGSGRLSIFGGSLINNSTTGHLVVNPTGTLEGHVTVGGTPFAQIHNSGRVIADGGTLDLSIYTGSGGVNSVLNPTENTSDKGWFAVDQGKLVLPSRTPVTGDSAQNWGEPDADVSIDLVNSARLAFTGLTQTGTMGWSGGLLAVDHGDVPVFDFGFPKQGLISVHELTSFGFTVDGIDLTIRYDDIAAGEFETVLRLFHYTGGAWVDVTTSLDTTNKWISAAGLTSFSLFAVGYAIPEPTSLTLLAAAGLALLARRQRR